MTKTKIAAILLTIVLMTGLLSGCAAANSPESVFPISFSAFENHYTITGYQVKQITEATSDSDDPWSTAIPRTIIKMIGNGLDNIKADYDFSTMTAIRYYIPVRCEYTVGGEEYGTDNIAAATGTMFFGWGEIFEPDTISFINGETGEIIVTFSVADTPQVP